MQCSKCGSTVTGSYCHKCGTKQIFVIQDHRAIATPDTGIQAAKVDHSYRHVHITRSRFLITRHGVRSAFRIFLIGCCMLFLVYALLYSLTDFLVPPQSVYHTIRNRVIDDNAQLEQLVADVQFGETREDQWTKNLYHIEVEYMLSGPHIVKHKVRDEWVAGLRNSKWADMLFNGVWDIVWLHREQRY